MTQAKDISDEAFLTAVAEMEYEPRPYIIPHDRVPHWVSRWDLHEQRFPDVPQKVLLAKARKLIRQNRLDGCWCGCRGDFEIPTKGEMP